MHSHSRFRRFPVTYESYIGIKPKGCLGPSWATESPMSAGVKSVAQVWALRHEQRVSLDGTIVIT